MKKYTKPTLDIVQLRVKEDLANNGNLTTYNKMDLALGQLSYETLELS